MLLTGDQVNDYKGSAPMLPVMPDAPVLIYDRGYDADWFRQALRSRGIRPCIPGRANRAKPIRQSKELYRQAHKVEIMFGHLEYWRRVATRYNRCAHTFMSAIALAATVLFWLPCHESSCSLWLLPRLAERRTFWLSKPEGRKEAAMNHHAGLDLSMETTHICVVDAEGRKIGAACIDSTPAKRKEGVQFRERVLVRGSRVYVAVALVGIR